MLFIFSTPGLNKFLWQLFLHWCLIRGVLLANFDLLTLSLCMSDKTNVLYFIQVKKVKTKTFCCTGLEMYLNNHN